jgi:hypothetical protein
MPKAAGPGDWKEFATEVFGMAALVGLILGFMFGVGCAFAVLYTIYMGGYRKAIAESIQDAKSARYLMNEKKVRAKLGIKTSEAVEQ